MHISRTGEVPTRSHNWHDWFNALAWLAWPHSKEALNARHVRAIRRGEQTRATARCRHLAG
jgi:acyl-coenzyme A thioesterase PaaI-like protein